jgi:hypothetical protein
MHVGSLRLSSRNHTGMRVALLCLSLRNRTGMWQCSDGGR